MRTKSKHPRQKTEKPKKDIASADAEISVK